VYTLHHPSSSKLTFKLGGVSMLVSGFQPNLAPTSSTTDRWHFMIFCTEWCEIWPKVCKNLTACSQYGQYSLKISSEVAKQSKWGFVWRIIANMPLMHDCFPYVGTDLCLTSQQSTLQNHGYGLVYHAMWLFTLPAFAGYSFYLPTEGWLRLNRPGCPVLYGGGLPVLRRSASRHGAVA